MIDSLRRMLFLRTQGFLGRVFHQACIGSVVMYGIKSRPQVMQTLGYPLAMNDRIPEITEARNIELGLGLQVFTLQAVVWTQQSQKPYLQKMKMLFSYFVSGESRSAYWNAYQN